MKITSRGRYALKVMIDIAEQNSCDFIKLDDIAKRQNISEKYLESIIAPLTKSNILIGVRGKGGGYKLSKKPEEYTVGSILKITEGSLTPVSCLDCKPNTCINEASCKTLPLWQGLDSVIDNYLESVTLADLVLGKLQG
ncbi:MAG: RrF2 family transcriptional regulator [Clostridia bacterium]